VISEEKEE